ncbi:hypothetical protein DFH09DRAFT_1084926 [Mycena vulgaris]|nr:hypothetical protein DFH09DRAFT_1084926 [Mycena vulgaris]
MRNTSVWLQPRKTYRKLVCPATISEQSSYRLPEVLELLSGFAWTYICDYHSTPSEFQFALYRPRNISYITRPRLVAASASATPARYPSCTPAPSGSPHDQLEPQTSIDSGHPTHSGPQDARRRRDIRLRAPHTVELECEVLEAHRVELRKNGNPRRRSVVVVVVRYVDPADVGEAVPPQAAEEDGSECLGAKMEGVALVQDRQHFCGMFGGGE